MFDEKGILKKGIISKIITKKRRSIICFSDGTNYKLVNTIIDGLKDRFNSNLINEKVTFITHDNKNIKYIIIRDSGALDVSIPPLP
jgi:hypothetical protein